MWTDQTGLLLQKTKGEAQTIMRIYFHLAIIFFYASLSRFWYIDAIPPVINPGNVPLRILTGAVSIATILCLFFYTKQYTKSSTSALVSAWLFAVLPWTVEQGRIVSTMQMILPLVFLPLFLIGKRNQKTEAVIAGFLLIVTLIYISFQPVKPVRVILNTFTLLSPEMLFFQNTTFWWGGVKAFGMLFAAAFPFALLGGMIALCRRMWMPISFILMFACIAASNPLFPEGRLFYLAIPFLSLITAIGLHAFYSQRNTIVRFFFWVIMAAIVYEMMQFWHHYVIHFPQEIHGNMGKIIGAY